MEINFPTVEALEAELEREKYKSRYKKVFRSTIYILVTVAAVAILIATFWMPVLRIYGTSMEPALVDGQIAICIKNSSFEQGDIVAFYYNNKILVKRVIAGPGDWVDISSDGTVFVNNQELIEPYLIDKDQGTITTTLPMHMQEERYFLMGDHRSVSVDSRNIEVGPIAVDQIVGKVVFVVWPLSDFGKVGS